MRWPVRGFLAASRAISATRPKIIDQAGGDRLYHAAILIPGGKCLGGGHEPFKDWLDQFPHWLLAPSGGSSEIVLCAWISSSVLSGALSRSSEKEIRLAACILHRWDAP